MANSLEGSVKDKRLSALKLAFVEFAVMFASEVGWSLVRKTGQSTIDSFGIALCTAILLFAFHGTGARFSAMRVHEKKTYIRVGVLGFGGFMFIASTILDVYRRTSSPPGTTSYARNVIVNLLIWPLAGYLVGLVSWKLVGESDDERPTNQ